MTLQLETAATRVCDQRVHNELLFAKRHCQGLSKIALQRLRKLLLENHLSITSGDVIFLETVWYVTHLGLLRIAKRSRCAGIKVQAVTAACDFGARHWVFRATVYKSKTCRGFVGYGDADPTNIAPSHRGAEMRIAETRAVNRALRKAYGIGICSIEELGSSVSVSARSVNTKKISPQSANGNGDFGGTKLRDRLCRLIRQHRLDAHLVKSYAVDFCGTKNLREATREQVEAFVTHLADWAEKDRNALLCQLNSYLPVQSKEAGAA
jgi:hypothetical protein